MVMMVMVMKITMVMIMMVMLVMMVDYGGYNMVMSMFSRLCKPAFILRQTLAGHDCDQDDDYDYHNYHHYYDDDDENNHRRRTFGGATGAYLDVGFRIGTDVTVTIPVPQVKVSP